ncbi:MAG: hypothetical protein KME31_29730 [Tolypothrix carrinoi HA7290-LM1]|nr:hypothetical protein [Tolypothrix carrinoi HA7290-LM1]
MISGILVPFRARRTSTTPIHNFKATTEWLNEEIFHDHINPNNVGKTVVRTAEIVGAGVVGVLVARKLLKMLGDDKSDKS